jgi:hypothetical protein
MRKLPAVEEAKGLMNEARDWKRKVRVAADEANAALSAFEKKVKAAWGDELKQAYRALPGKPEGDGAENANAIRRAVERVKLADVAAENARLEAEAIFDEAERRLSTSLAREGTEKAIASWKLREKAIREAEALTRNS